MPSLDFTNAQLKHNRWRTRLRSFLDGKQEVNESELTSPKECELGKWLYGEGLAKYRQIQKMRELEKVHAEMHATVECVVRKKTSCDGPGAELEYQKVVTKSQRITALLMDLRKEVT